MFVCDGTSRRVENDLRLPGVGDGTVVRTFDAPEAMGINFHEVRARSALNHVPGGRYGFNWTINPYRGCTHACVLLLRSPHPHLSGLRRRSRLRARDRRQGQRAGAAAGRAGAAELEAGAGGAGDEHRSLPVGREPLPDDAGDPRGAGGGGDAGLGADQVAAGDARRRDLRADGEEAAGLGQPLGADPRRGRLAGDRAAHARAPPPASTRSPSCAAAASTPAS